MTELEKLNETLETLQAQKMLLVAQEKERKKTARAAQKAVEKVLAAEKKLMRASSVSYQKGKLKESDIKQETSEEEEQKEPVKSKAKKEDPLDEDAALFLYFKSLFRPELEEKD